MTERRSVVAWERWGWWPGDMRNGQESVGGMIIKGHKENLGGDEYICYINYSNGFKGEYVCQN